MLLSFIKKLAYQQQLLLLAVSFFTRIPVTITSPIAQPMFHQASRYFALVGLFVGLISALFYWLLIHVFSPSLAVLFVMVSNVLLTGAFHEDGWADVWDGFGGGWSVEQKLNIMKDSRLGTYGAAALFLMLALKYQSLTEIGELALVKPVILVMISLVVAHTLSRVLATSLIYCMHYVSEDATSKAKPVVQCLSTTSLLVLLSTGAVVLFGFIYWQQALCLIALLWLLRLGCICWFNRQLGGYTGDCLGAAQQLAELMIYLTLLAFTSPGCADFFAQPLSQGAFIQAVQLW